jgi:hypothetical protein
MAEVKRYVTPPFRLSFPSLFEKSSYNEGTPKYGGTAVWHPSLFTESDKKRWKVLMAAVDEASKAKFKKPWKELPANIKRGIRDGAEKADLEGFGEGTLFANITTMMKPGVIDRAKDENGEFIKINEENGNTGEIYPGCWCRATVTVYSYDNVGKGIALGLMNIQKVKDDARLDSRTDASEDFEDEDLDESWEGSSEAEFDPLA